MKYEIFPEKVLLFREKCVPLHPLSETMVFRMRREGVL